MNTLRHLNVSKGTGLDKIPAKMLRIAADIIAPSLTYIFNLSISTGVFFDNWKDARVIFIKYSSSMAVTHAFSVSVIILLFHVICGEKLLTLTWKNIKTHSSYENVNNECLVNNHCLNFLHLGDRKRHGYVQARIRRGKFLAPKQPYYSNTMACFQLRRLLLSCGDVNSNPGPTTNSVKCFICDRTVARNHRFVNCTMCERTCHIKCGGVTSSEYKSMQKMSNIAWSCSLCLLSTMPFANCSIDSDTSTVNPMADSSHQTMISTNTTIPNNGRFRNLSCGLINARSLKNKLIEFQTAVYAENLDIIAVTETWLDESVYDKEILSSGYDIHRRD